MKQTLTLTCKLQPTSEQDAKLEATLKAFADACNYANQVVKPSVLNGRSIQSLVYDSLRERFGLSANLAVRACAICKPSRTRGTGLFFGQALMLVRKPRHEESGVSLLLPRLIP